VFIVAYCCFARPLHVVRDGTRSSGFDLGRGNPPEEEEEEDLTAAKVGVVRITAASGLEQPTLSKSGA